MNRRGGDLGRESILSRTTHPLCLPVRVSTRPILYKNTNIGLKRRLRTLFNAGYGVILIVIKNSSVNPDRLKHYLKQLGPIRVGRLDPSTWKTSLGSLIKRDTVNLDAPAWDRMPAYLLKDK